MKNDDLKKSDVNCIIASPLVCDKDVKTYIDEIISSTITLYKILDKFGTLFLHLKDTRTEEGNLNMIPQKIAIKMIANGWILRNKIILKITLDNKNKDRFSDDYSYLYFFVKNKKYFYEQQFEPLSEASFSRMNYGFGKGKMEHEDNNYAIKTNGVLNHMVGRMVHPEKGRNMRTVWSMSFLQAIETCIKAGCPEFVCKKCGKARDKVYEEIEHEPIEVYTGQAIKDYESAKVQNPSDTKRRILKSMAIERKFIGYTDCGCKAEFKPGLLLDPFKTSNVIKSAALQLNRNFLEINL